MIGQLYGMVGIYGMGYAVLGLRPDSASARKKLRRCKERGGGVWRGDLTEDPAEGIVGAVLVTTGRPFDFVGEFGDRTQVAMIGQTANYPVRWERSWLRSCARASWLRSTVLPSLLPTGPLPHCP